MSTILEWDHDIPEWPTLVAHNEANRVAGRSVHGEVAPWRR